MSTQGSSLERPAHEPVAFDAAQLATWEKLPSLPAVALEVIQVCRDPEADIDELVAVLSRDPTLAARVLRMANSPAYYRGSDVTSLRRAAVTLGLRALRVLALGFTLAGELPQRGTRAGFDLGEYWHRSIVTAAVARSLCPAVGVPKSEEAFLCGLLSHIGKLALAEGMAGAYAPVVAAGNGWPSAQLELELLGFTSGDVAAALLQRWGLPEVIVAGATATDRLGPPQETDDEAIRHLVELTRLAKLAAAVFFETESGTKLARFGEEAERLYGLSPSDADELLARLGSAVHETADSLSVELPAGISYQEILDEARMQIVTLSLDTVASLEQTTLAADQLSREKMALEAKALTDPLTGLPNRAALEDFLARQLHHRLRESVPEALGILMIDLDRFKSVNDTYGHRAGDEVLRSAAAAMLNVTRGHELLARYGGEEFCVVLPQSSPEALRIAGERLRAAIASRAVDLGGGKTISVTGSVGGACLERIESEEDGARLVELADQHLYRAKENGRNRVEIRDERS
jgi:diguanylate cyclase (GGDEF)-like protein